ncbi:universal stress protein [Pricia sp. S334]|uniref:Universal stress protein n=1 Tax=Pricia mediterranea TaxID=3076079 RepID=A0ABU3L867_9FLAO|nr:universal stress protein [Pricia sp. S334]MDT7829875.1 universal stress protein [Pricia sp. S334]
MDKRILLLTDFSKNALNAALYALDLYSDRVCSFYILNTYGVDGFSIDGSAYTRPGQSSHDIAKSETEIRFKNFMQMLRMHSDNSKHTYETIASYDSLLDGVKKVVAKKDIDIIIMGTKGMTGSRTVLFGMNTVNVMEKVTECPVLAVPEDIKFRRPKEIVFPTDYKKPFKRRELKYLITIAQMHNTSIQVLHVMESNELSESQEDNKELLKRIFKEVGHSFHELEGASVNSEINAFIDKRNSAMVAFVNYKRNFFSKLISRPLVRDLGYQSRVPVLVLRNRT